MICQPQLDDILTCLDIANNLSLAGDLLHVGAVNCASTINQNLCSIYGVTDFPTLKVVDCMLPTMAVP